MKRALTILLVLAMPLVLSAQANRPARQAPAAAPTTERLADVEPRDAGALTIMVGTGKTVNFREDSVRIALADESIARVRVLSSREVMVDGLKPGRTTLFVWMNSGRRIFHSMLVEYNLEPARAALRQISPTLVLETGADAESVVLRGEVSNESVARQARAVVEQLLPRSGSGDGGLRLVNLIRHQDFVGTLEDRLAQAMAAIDPRIKVRRIQSGPEPSLETDSYILEGAVRDVSALVQAVVLADRQLGGTGKTVKAADDDRVTFQRSNSSSSSAAGGGMGTALQGSEPPRSSLAAQLARGLLVTSESGRVVSFLEVDLLPQISVAIRVMEIDRNKARDLGLDFRVDTDKLSIANITIPGGGNLTQSGDAGANVGNVVGSYVGATASVVAALKFLDEKRVARSVAEPNVLTMSGEQASVLVGGEVPIPITNANTIVSQTGFSFQQFGVRLDIRPTVDRDGMVTLEVAPSIVSPSAALGNGIVPGFRIQRVETTARVQAGESLILGGLLASNESVQERGIPLLGKLLPIFRWKRTSTENTELLFVITPRLVTPPSANVVLPPLQFQDSPNRSGATGLDANGVPISFLATEATVAGQQGVCLEVRDRANKSGVLVDCLLPGVKVTPLEQQGEWRRVRLSNGKEGWALETRLQFPKPGQ